MTEEQNMPEAPQDPDGDGAADEPHTEPHGDDDATVEEQGEDSFPASDPPANY